MKLIMYPAVTLDGFIADLNGECYEWISDADEALYEERIMRAGCSLVGRKTYEQYIDDYPSKRGTTTFVYTSQAGFVDQDKVKFMNGTPAEVLQQIEAAGFDEVVMSGGGETNGAFAEAGLIDEIIISMYNVTLGEGIKLFGSHKPKLKLELIATSQDIPGIVKNHYKVLN